MPAPKWEVIQGDVRAVLPALPDASVDCCVTSPPYWGLRDYGVAGQIGLESTPAEYVSRMVEVFREVRRVLKDDGTLWLNLGDSYAGSYGNQGRKESRGEQRRINGPMIQDFGRVVTHAIDCDMDEDCSCSPAGKYPSMMSKTGSLDRTPGLKQKDLVGIPWRVAFALQADGWYLRSDIIWSKPNPMPESVTDRPTKAHEYLFLLSKNERYYYDSGAIAEESIIGVREGGTNAYNLVTQTGGRDTQNLGGSNGTRNKRSVWTVTTEPFPGAHFAVMPTALVKPCVLAGCRPGGTVLDPFAGSGTVGEVAHELGCGFIGCDLNPAYVEIAQERIGRVARAPMLDFGGAG